MKDIYFERKIVKRVVDSRRSKRLTREAELQGPPVYAWGERDKIGKRWMRLRRNRNM